MQQLVRLSHWRGGTAGLCACSLLAAVLPHRHSSDIPHTETLGRTPDRPTYAPTPQPQPNCTYSELCPLVLPAAACSCLTAYFMLPCQIPAKSHFNLDSVHCITVEATQWMQWYSTANAPECARRVLCCHRCRPCVFLGYVQQLLCCQDVCGWLGCKDRCGAARPAKQWQCRTKQGMLRINAIFTRQTRPPTFGVPWRTQHNVN